MLTDSELDILEKANCILKKKRKIKKENKKNEFDNKKRKVFEDEIDKLLEKKQKFLNEIDNIDKEMEEYKIMTLEGIKYSISKIDQELKNLGEYTGQCLHKKKKYIASQIFIVMTDVKNIMFVVCVKSKSRYICKN